MTGSPPGAASLPAGAASLPAGGAPAAEVVVTEEIVRALLRSDVPELAHLPLRLGGTGWDTTTWRVGDHLAVRLPRRLRAAQQIEVEQRWLGVLQPLLPVPIPQPRHAGRPRPQFPLPWSLVPWFAGSVAASQPRSQAREWAALLAQTLAALHTVAPPDGPRNEVRGVPLADRAETVSDRLDQLERVPQQRPLAAHLRRIWRQGLDAEVWTGPPLWVHGDVHPGNLLVATEPDEVPRTLAALLDFSDLTIGDPATDLAAAWLVFDAPGRAVFQASYEAEWGARSGKVVPGHADPGRWRRAAAWAVSMAASVLIQGDHTNLRWACPALGELTGDPPSASAGT